MEVQALTPEHLGMLQKVWQSAPQEVREACPNLISAVGQLATMGVFMESAQPLQDILTHLNPSVVASPDVARNLIQQTSNHSTIAQNADILMTHMTSNLECPCELKQAVTGALSKAGNAVLITSTICGSLQLIINFVHLWNLFESVKDARQVVLNSATGRKGIEDKMRLIPGRLAELDQLVKELEEGEGLTLRKITLINVQATRKKNSIGKEVIAILKDIGDLEANVSGCKVKLESVRRQMFMGCVSGITNGISTAIGVTFLGSIANPTLLVVASVSAAANLIIGAVGITKALLARDELEELAKELNKLLELRSAAEIQENQLNALAEDILDRIEQLTLAQEDN